MSRQITHITILISFFLSAMGIAQTKTLQGKVSDMQGLAVEGAAIVVYDASKNIKKYTVTDALGMFSMESEIVSTDMIEITHIAYVKQQKEVSSLNLSQEIIHLDIILEDNTDSLDQVVIISSNEVKDTVRLDLEKLKLYEDDNLKDILSKIPNFRLTDDGTIIYKGKNIDKILVNKKPSFENQNNIALESIEKKIIKDISVINNYNDEFTLDFDETEESVLNIDLKESQSSILNGSLEAKAGYQDKYELRAKGFMFSENLNAFFTNNTNNIGKTTISAREIKNIFKTGLPISEYQEHTLGDLFATNENLQKDFFSSTNLTLRNQTQRLKTSAVLYYFTPDRINSVVQDVSTLDNVSLLSSIEKMGAKTHSFLGAASLAYKLTNKSILTYNINIDYVNAKNNSFVENQLFDNGNPEGVNTTVSNNNNNIFSQYHQLLFTSKLQKKLILETKGTYYSEGNTLLNDFTIRDAINMTNEAQAYRFDKNEAQASLALKYKVSDKFIPKLSTRYVATQDELKDRELTNAKLLRRERDEFFVNLTVEGDGVVKGLDYNVMIGVNPFTNRIVTDNIEQKDVFIPTKASISYEDRVNRYHIKYERTRTFNELLTGITTIQPFNSIWNGDLTFPANYNTSSYIKASYDYTNIFDGEAFAVSTSFEKNKNVLRKNFLGQENGISTFELFMAEESSTFKVNSYYAKTVAPLSYPTKVTLSATYTSTQYPAIINQFNTEVTTQTIEPTLTIETITDKLLNFRVTSEVSFNSDEVANTTYEAVYTRNSAAVLLKNKAWRGNVSFLYDNNRINGITYTRKNLNLGLSYTYNKITFSMEARHIGELLSFFENDAYNSQFIITNGITNTIINNQSLNYIIGGIKFKL
ncbi:peptidase associated/transthyretin-like domain-containing protein [Kordia zhangzhouensis]|uniref:carboxypeptidase-like regulatory domain-containing protein n=1 Tax=Kordia zhangzhouensis TaxID=1620405 RepID=UPI000A8F143D|nr:carboxypeptidase-like regulatory domain-containing protein [Kordia zhangzhouensis]